MILHLILKLSVYNPLLTTISLLPANKIRAHRNRLIFPSVLPTWLLTRLLRLLIWSRVVLLFLINTVRDCVVYSDAYKHVHWECVGIVCQRRAGARRMNSAQIKLSVSFFLSQFSRFEWIHKWRDVIYSHLITVSYPDKHETFICCKCKNNCVDS